MAKTDLTKSGIYKIENMVTGECYVGSAVNMNGRKRQHLHHLRQGKHHSPYLQRSYNKHGEEAFVFSILEECAREVLTERETYWIRKLKPKYNGNTVTATRLGMTTSELTKEKLREYNLRPEVVAKKRADSTGRKRTPEVVEQIKAARAKQAITESMLQGLELGRQISPEQRKGMTGKKHSEATKQKQREAALKQSEQRSEALKRQWQHGGIRRAKGG